MYFMFSLLTILIFIQLSNSDVTSTETVSDKLKSMKLPPCQSCKQLTESFKKGMERTARGKFEGGDAAWEEEKLGSYAHSEVRLTEIQESLCFDVEKGNDQCHSLAENNEQAIEDWWFHRQSEEPDFHKWLCIEHLKMCCPENHFGSDCTPCPGYPNDICNKNGKCKGAGTRKGNGKCSCDKGYDGDMCERCNNTYYESYRDELKFLCSPCHPSCLSSCSQAGSKGCSACKDGWIMDMEKGCVDIDECFTLRNPCLKSQFCVNKDGSFSCYECDRACDSCDGDGPDLCIQCALGYTLQDNVCVDERQLNLDFQLTWRRYSVYFGLCVATCIIFQKNTALASVIGLLVALYISASEYILWPSGADKYDKGVNGGMGKLQDL